MNTLRSRRPRERGGALAVATVLVIFCAAAAAAAITTGRGWQRDATSETGRERAFQLAESGVDWAVARLRATHGALPAGPEQGFLGGIGAWNVNYGSGTANGSDDDGDGTVDEADEGRFTSILATGTASGVQRSIRVLLRAPEVVVGFDGAAVLNSGVPVFDVNGNAFTIDGTEHFLDGSADGLRPAKYAVSSPIDPAIIAAQVPVGSWDQLQGRSGVPSIGQSPALDLDALIAQAKLAATEILPPGTYATESFGSPVAGSTQVVSCDGDLHFSGNTSGAGILVVDGDLRISGQFTWVGMVLVRGRAEMVGGGGTKRIIGALIVGEEVGTPASMTVSGTIDLLYSTDAVDLAAQSLVVPAVLMWREAGSP